MIHIKALDEKKQRFSSLAVEFTLGLLVMLILVKIIANKLIKKRGSDNHAIDNYLQLDKKWRRVNQTVASTVGWISSQRSSHREERDASVREQP